MTIHASAFVHETAVVETGAFVGAGSQVWHHCHLRSGARVGSHSKLGMNVYVDDGGIVGDYCKIQNNVSIYRGVTLGNKVFVGPSVVFTNDLRPRALVDGWTLVPTVIEEGVSIGANSTIVAGVTIGAWAMVGAGTVVLLDVRSHSLVVGNPARQIGWVCVCGQTLGSGTTPISTSLCPFCGRSSQPGL